MTRPKSTSRYPVTSFGPELLELLIKGSRDTVTVPCPDAKTLMALQQRLHMLRGAMAREKHPQYALVTRARTSRQWDKDGEGTLTNFRLIVQPNDKQFSDILAAAGVKPSDTTKDILDETPIEPSPVNPTIEPSPSSDSDEIYDRFK